MPTTQWTMVRGLAANATQRRGAMERFAGNYWSAVYAYVRFKGESPEDAEDLTQRFLAELLERDAFGELSADQGRFRSWLRACLQNFLRSHWRDASRQKRGGEAVHLSIDRDLGEFWVEGCGSEELSPEVVFDRRWAASILERALAELRRAYERDGREELLKAVLPTIAGAERRPGYGAIGEDLGMPEAHVRVAAFRMRRRLQQLIRDEVAATVSSSKEVDAELAALFGVFESRNGIPSL